MITGELFISTTWAASTSFIPFDIGMRDAQGGTVGSVPNRGYFGTTAYVHGIWDYQVFEEGLVANLSASDKYAGVGGSGIDEIRGMGGGYYAINNVFSPGTVIEIAVRKIKALKASPNRSGVQVSRRMLKGNKLVFKYLAKGELVRP
ncbi:hypothetical protein KKH23_08685 [Patescibacteria group bacterium]|nr:hypothetical protein [Patescibacteria group bacterium]